MALADPVWRCPWIYPFKTLLKVSIMIQIFVYSYLGCFDQI